MNVLASINERVEIRDAQRVAEKHGVVIEREKKPEHKPPPKKEATPAQKAAEDVNKQIVRPPVVVFMGHVDHGKTSLLDRIRHASVAAGEAGGITQHIGAYRVAVGPQHITFLDTPGHEAFTAMRARGAHLTDIAVIVIAADDGVMPQTEEAIKHAEAAEVPLLVAINKVDLKTANADRVKQQLAAMGKTPEDWGGEVICCPVSAATGEGLDHLLEMILLQAEMLELRAAPNRRARGYVVESRLEAGMGPTATLLVTEGTLRPSDPLVCGPCWGRIRALIDERGVKVKEAGPSTPVQCLGLNGVPDAGAEFKVLADEKDARAEAEQRLAELRAQQVAVPRRASLDTLFQKLRDSDKLELRVVLKTDVQGSLEAIQKALEGIRSDKVTLRILLAAVGNVTANDVLLASASKAAVLGFHVAADEEVIRLAKQQGVEIRLHSIIYDLVDQVRDAMAGLLEPVLREKVVGHARLQQVFTLSHNIVVAGCLVTDGHVTPRVKVRVKRQDDVLYEGSILSLRRHQNDAAEVREGQECGIRLDNFAAFAEGDILEFYVVERIPQTL
jgi:translation initiation factor IF-2